MFLHEPCPAHLPNMKQLFTDLNRGPVRSMSESQVQIQVSQNHRSSHKCVRIAGPVTNESESQLWSQVSQNHRSSHTCVRITGPVTNESKSQLWSQVSQNHRSSYKSFRIAGTVGSASDSSLFSIRHDELGNDAALVQQTEEALHELHRIGPRLF